MNDVFISYSRRDKVFTQKLYEALKAANRIVWADWDSIPASSDWDAEIKQGIQETDSVLFVLSPEWIKSNECRKELVHAVAMGKRLFPILYLPVDPNDVPPELAKINWVYMRDTDDFDKAFQTLCSAMDTDLDWIKTHTRIQVRALEWDRKKRDHSFVLRGNDLTEGEQFIAGAANKSPVPTTLQSEYILASRKDATRRQRQILAGVTVALVVSIALGVVAFFQRQAAVENEKKAIEQSQIALARQLAAQAQLLNTNKSSKQLTASLLGIQSMKLYPNSDAASFLINNNLAAQPMAQMNQEAPVRKIMFSPDGKYLLTVSSEELRIWDVESQKEVNRFMSEYGVDSIEFSLDSKKIVYWECEEVNADASCIYSSVKVRSTLTGEDVFTISGSYIPADFSNLDRENHAFLISPDGKYIAISECNTAGICAKDKIEIRVLNTGEKVSSVMGDTSFPHFAISPDSKYVASVDCNRNDSDCVQRFVHVWDLNTGDEITQLSFEVPVENVAFSPDGKYLAVGGYQFTQVWQVADWESVWDIKVGRGEFTFSPDNKYLMVLGEFGGGKATVWEIETRNLVSEMDEGFLFSPDGRYIVSTIICCGTNTIWETASGNVILATNFDSGIASGAFSPDGKYFAGGGYDETARVWDLSTRKEVARIVHTGSVNSIAFVPNGDYVASGSEDGVIRLWKTSTKQEILSVPSYSGYTGVISDQHLIATECDVYEWEFGSAYCPVINTISTWDMTTGEKVKSVKLNTSLGDYIPNDYSEITMLSPGGKYAVSIDCNKRYSDTTGCEQYGFHHIWDVATGREVLHSFKTDNWTMTFSPDERYLFFIECDDENCSDTSIQKWEVASKEKISMIPIDRRVESIVVSPNNRYLAVSANENWYLIDSFDGKVIAHIASAVYALAFSSDNEYLAIRYDGSSTRLLRIETGEEVKSLLYETDGPVSMAFSPDSKYLASGGGRFGVVRLLEVSTGTEVYSVFRGDWTNSLAYSPDGKYLVSVSPRQTNANITYVVYVWDAVTGTDLFQIEGNLESINFSPDGKYLISTQGYSWPFENEAIIANACAYLPRNLTRAEWEQFIGDAMPYQAVCDNLPLEPEVTATPTATP